MNLNRELRAFVAACGFPESFEAQELPAEASARRYVRLRFAAPAEPASLMLCVGLPTPYRDQDRFVALCTHLEKQELPVPHIYGVERVQGALLLSDAGEYDLNYYLQRAHAAGETENKRKLIDHAVDILAKLQRLPIPEEIEDRSFDLEKLYSELEFLFDAVRSAANALSTPYLQLFELSQFGRELCRYLGKLTPQTLAHRDFHSRNIMVRNAGGKLHYTLIDFQDARKGSPFYDLASLLYDPYAPLDREERGRALHRYLDSAQYSATQKPIYLAVALQRMLKALGTYLHQSVSGNSRYAESIAPALDRIEEIVQEGRFPDSVYLFAREVRRRFLEPLRELASARSAT